MRIFFLIPLLLLAACSQEALPPLVASDIEILEPMPGTNMSAGYMALTNNSDSSIRLTSASSPNFASVELHETSIEDGISRMRPVDELVIEPGQTISLQRGGMHMMLRAPTDNVESVTLMLHSDDTILLSITTTILKIGS
jgi:copper(I)-binding protein